MKTDKILISGTGCALADFLYGDISFESQAFKKYISNQRGDGGLSPGKLVFTEELEKFSGHFYNEILNEITGGVPPDTFNIGGPSLVSLIHAAQMLDNTKFEIRFYGMAGKDDIAVKIKSLLKETPLNVENYLTAGNRATPFTDVFSDPNYNNGHGERTFINNIGAAREYSPGHLNDSFFDSHIVCFGGTALVPQIHDNLTELLKRAKNKNCITLVNTVFDFRSEKSNPEKSWPLVDKKVDYELIDILVMDCEEALKISGKNSIESAAEFFATTNVSAFIITNGAEKLYAKSTGRLFKKTDLFNLPVSRKVKTELNASTGNKGDTTGCGDNFSGGIIASLAEQLKNKSPWQLDFIEAISFGIASGGFTCFIMGGTYFENYPGEKRNKITSIYYDYLKQIGIKNGNNSAW